MLSKKEQDIVNELSRLLLDIFILANPPQLSARYQSIDSFNEIYANLIALRDCLYAMSNGDLSKPIHLKGFIGGMLKTLQANLKHLTWQTKMVASGDFTQRVEFMGEFSQSFNAMVIQLDQTLKELTKKERELNQKNEELLKEIAIRKEIEEALRKSEEALKIQAITDSLTGLYNRRHFHGLAEIEIKKSLRYVHPLSVIMFDIDFFKLINDTYGHSIGDSVLKMIAEIMKKNLRATDIPARYGGEEFIVLLPQTSVLEAAATAEKLRKLIENTAIQAENHEIKVTASFGVSDYLGKTDSKELEVILSDFISTADQTLYASKNAGRNRVTVYEPKEVIKNT